MIYREKVIKGLEEAHDVITKHVPVRYWGYSTFACTDAIAARSWTEDNQMNLEELREDMEASGEFD